MKVNEYDYYLDKALIAQSPLDKRDASRLLVLDRKTGKITHKHFYDILDYLEENDVLVINNTKVLKARMFGKKDVTNAKIELLLLEEVSKDTWDALTKPQRRIKIGDVVLFDNLKAECICVKEEGINTYRMIYDGVFLEVLDNIGVMPTPPYIHKTLKEQDRYQTVYSNMLGSSAAPTAGLHFTEDLIKRIKEKGIEIIEITLHVGLDTFRPISVDDIEDHIMHKEKYFISEEACKRLNEAVKNKKNIVAVGTTSVRTLEANYNNGFHSGRFETGIFIYPPYKFKVVDKLITNFHLPKSTLLMLVSAFAKKEFIFKAYAEAIKNEYLFFSFGDAMFIK
ncbi:MAG: tRNA preQ1(34) S-adenosylmethionine ribosyltransferase-isomerase QueA [Acholeplasmataceae bacterium]|nr:tRNA preQ1(34) S-adenosylmethionine ribosyltransferase-isomerase QueA [Acholeplasmataceae bacterium]